MPKINVLPKNIAELIAAGEVVERPASVIKELMENSVDAGATCVTVEIKNGGITYMRVTDDGCGISRSDVPLAFLSHATSKIKQEQDLDAIFTLGFRGEALASVASVARVELLTRPRDCETGTRFSIEGGQQTDIDDAGCPIGTTIVVRDLFYNTPARMKFLKRDVSEANAVSAVVDRIAMSHPEISVRFIRDGRQVLMTAGDGKLDSCTRTVLGREVSQTLIPVSYELDGVSVSGLVSKPAGSRATRSMQFFYLNKRYIKSKTVMAALEQAYKGSVMVGRFPSCVMNIDVAANTVDVNVHPAKTEVRFSDEKRIFSAVYYAVKSALKQLDTRPQACLSPQKPNAPVARQPHAVQMMMAEKSNDFWKRLSADEFSEELKVAQCEPVPPAASVNVSGEASTFPRQTSVRRINIDISAEDEPSVSRFAGVREEKAACSAELAAEPAAVSSASAACTPAAAEPVASVADAKPVLIEKTESKPDACLIGEAFRTYIIVQQGDKLIFIDKHAAHERMIYEKLKQNVDGSRQTLLSALPVTLSKAEYSAVIENLALISKAGYAVEDFGSGTVLVRECPMYIDYDEIPQMIQQLASHLLMNSSELETQNLDWLLHNSACRAAVKAGDKTPAAELESFARQLLENDSIRYCPHGRPVMIEMTRRELEKQFGRIQ